MEIKWADGLHVNDKFRFNKNSTQKKTKWFKHLNTHKGRYMIE